MTDRNRARGALVGMAVGDALGTTLEFSSPRAPAFPNLATGPLREVVGGGPFHVAPGQVTDDTQLACCLAASLLARGGFDADDIARRYVEWMPKAFDIGSQTSSSLRNCRDGMAPLEAGRAAWGGPDHPNAGNGSLMRHRADCDLLRARCGPAPPRVARGLRHHPLRSAMPPGLRRVQRGHRPRDRRRPRADAGGAARGGQERAAVRGGLPARGARGGGEVDRRRPGGAEDRSDAAEIDDPGLYGAAGSHIHRQQGFVRVAFRLAFWELMHVASFEETLVDVVNRGGDSDTNGAIAGGLLGACHGESAIPVRWSKVVLAALQDGPPGPWRDAYHPKVLMALVP